MRYTEEDYEDYDYEQFRESTGHITNFSAGQMPFYKEAIEKYRTLHPDTKMYIGDDSRYGNLHGFYAPGERSLSEFWSIFDAIKAKAAQPMTLGNLLRSFFKPA